ncbi:MAG: hypothetical protein Q4G27_07975 [Flavobacteriaceae bacterium]|nr:hypothetical protein [Flavobacteriaceae bacterium]
MRKQVDIDDLTLTKLKVISVFEKISVKALMEKAIRLYVEEKQKNKAEMMTDEEKEDLGLWLLMQESDGTTVSEEEIFKILNS